MENPEIFWATCGLILILLELIVPGIYLIWFGIAAFVVSLIMMFIPLETTDQVIVFAIFSAIFAVIGLFCYKYVFNKAKTPEEYKDLNNRAQQYVGQTVTLTENVNDGQTKVKIGDGVWIANCQTSLKKNDKAIVVGVKDDMILLIEPKD